MRPEFASLRNQPEVSVLIIGGGINGIGLLNELALQGVDALLVDKSDFCAGTSAAMTRVIHGGLRYLENAEFRLVRESLRERNRLLRNAPHYVKPLPTTIPIFSWTSGIVPAIRNLLGWPTKPGNRGALLIKTGLTVYDFLAGRQSPLPRHRFRFRRAALALRPALNPEVICTATYYDAKITYPERLCLELVLDAEAACPGARALNYVGLQSAAGGTVVLRDEVSGETCEVRPRIVVNAAGPWIDLVNRGLGRASRFIGGTKGSHIVLDHPELVEATGDEMIYFVNRDGRICIFYAVHGRIVAGATDIPAEDPEAVCDEGEVDYILEAMRQAFPSIHVDRSHVVFRFCGVRPLPRSDALTPGQISRDHSFPALAAGEGVDFPIYSLVGGKWTTFRALAEKVANEILRVLGRPRVRDSADVPIGGGKGDPHTPGGTGLPQERVGALVERYGSGAEKVAAYLLAGPDSPLAGHAGYSRREIEFMALHERVVHLDDLVLRRTLMGLLGQVTGPLLEELAGVVAPALGWSREHAASEVERTLQLLERVHGVMAAALSKSPFKCS
ncbi:MAG TPA: glycerol-3-phosphate dehydrogenase/oxidase [Bryobacteraceae bacterium]|nr:glycerol-3-phosphate dehydrogenase/oxidase [Bryobacteraceae bacterium]